MNWKNLFFFSETCIQSVLPIFWLKLLWKTQWETFGKWCGNKDVLWLFCLRDPSIRSLDKLSMDFPSFGRLKETRFTTTSKSIWCLSMYGVASIWSDRSTWRICWQVKLEQSRCSIICCGSPTSVLRPDRDHCSNSEGKKIIRLWKRTVFFWMFLLRLILMGALY